MYLPENDAQMFDILSELRIYAAMNGLPQLAEKLDDALILLSAGARGRAHGGRAVSAVNETYNQPRLLKIQNEATADSTISPSAKG